MSKSLIIDAGHGGADNGSSGNGLLEKNINLKMSLYQYKRLKELGANVDITRTTDKNLSSTKRTNMIRNNYDICISNHFNAFNGKARGVETIHSYLGGKQLASDLASAIVKTSGIPLRRVFSRRLKNGKDYYFMHRLTGRTRTVIIEYGFIDNKSDMSYYKDDNNFYKVGESVVKVLCKYLGVKYKQLKDNVSHETKPTFFKKNVAGAKLVKSENAYFLPNHNIKVRTQPTTKSRHTGTLPKGTSINYFAVYSGNGYRWLLYHSTKGVRFVPYRRLKGNTKPWGSFHSKRP